MTRRRASQWDTARMSFSIINQKLISPERNVMMLKQIHASKNGYVLCFQSVNADPSQGSQQPDSRESPAPVTMGKTKPRSVQRVHSNARIRKTLCHSINQNLHNFDTTSCFCRTKIQYNISLKHNCLQQFRIKTPSCSQVKRVRSIFTSFARSFRLSFRTLSPEMTTSATDKTR